jgi:hypothetical protein
VDGVPAPPEPLTGWFGLHGFVRLEHLVVRHSRSRGPRARLHQRLVQIGLRRGVGVGPVAGLAGACYRFLSLGLRGGWVRRAIGIVRSAGFVLRVVFRLGLVGGFQKVPFELTGMLLWRRSRIIPAPPGRPVLLE